MFQTTVFHAAVRAPVGLVSGVLSHVTMQVILSLTPIITERAQESRCQLSADIGAVWNITKLERLSVNDTDSDKSISIFLRKILDRMRTGSRLRGDFEEASIAQLSQPLIDIFGTCRSCVSKVSPKVESEADLAILSSARRTRSETSFISPLFVPLKHHSCTCRAHSSWRGESRSSERIAH